MPYRKSEIVELSRYPARSPCVVGLALLDAARRGFAVRPPSRILTTRADSAIPITRSASASRIAAGSRVVTARPRANRS